MKLGLLPGSVAMPLCCLWIDDPFMRFGKSETPKKNLNSDLRGGSACRAQAKNLLGGAKGEPLLAHDSTCTQNAEENADQNHDQE